MGSAFSSITASQVIFVTLVCGALAYRHYYLKNPALQRSIKEAARPIEHGVSNVAGTDGKKKKGKKGASAGTGADAENALPVEGTKPIVLPFPRVVPGEFAAPSDADATEGGSASASEPTARSKKAKKKKSGAAPAGVTDAPVATTPSANEPEKSAAPVPAVRPSKNKKSLIPSAAAAAPQKNLSKDQRPPAQEYDTDSSWTRVEPSRSKSRRAKGEEKGGDDTKQQLGVATDFTISDTGASGVGDSPVTERTDDEFPVVGTSSGVSSENRRTFAEKMLPKPLKTGVDDMLEQPDYPAIARVMKVRPGSGEQPPAGFSWQDYEDVDANEKSGVAQNDGDAGDDEGEWGVVKSKSRSKPTREASTSSDAVVQKAPDTMTKKQRQNANRRAAEKAAKVDQEVDRLARQAKHKRELERERIIEQSHNSAGKRGVGGGMSASVDTRGKMVFD